MTGSYHVYEPVFSYLKELEGSALYPEFCAIFRALCVSFTVQSAYDPEKNKKNSKKVLHLAEDLRYYR